MYKIVQKLQPEFVVSKFHYFATLAKRTYTVVVSFCYGFKTTNPREQSLQED